MNTGRAGIFGWFISLGRWLTCGLNGLTGGSFQQSFSARCYQVWHSDAGWRGALAGFFVDVINGASRDESHCRNSWLFYK